MRPRRGLPASVGSQVNVTPLIDIVMVLIVFFMLVARIGISTGAEPMTLPETIQGTRIEDMGNTLTLNVRPGPGEQPTITTLLRAQKQELKVLEPATGRRPLTEALRFFRFGKDARDPRDDNPDFKVIIRAEKDLPYRYLEPVLLACAEAHVKNVNFNTAMVIEEVK